MPGRGGMVLAVCLIVGACSPREDRSIGAVDPLNSIPAIQDAARTKDRHAIPALVRQLDSDDPALRFYAIQALRDLTGQIFGYHYFDSAEERRPAVHAWQEWMRKNVKP
jgi:hypothetical protein